MTLQNIRYILEIANCNSFSKAAKNLFMTQSAISNAVRETEKELGIRIFDRSNKGATLTFEGEDFLKYGKEIVSKADYLATKYQKKNEIPMHFSVSAQHLPFAVRAFHKLLPAFHNEKYNISIRETDTGTLFHDVSIGNSEIGVAAFQNAHIAQIRKSLYFHSLTFNEITQMNYSVYLRRQHPLAEKESVSFEDLKDFPFVTYDYASDPDQYTEEPLFYEFQEKNIHVTDRSTKLEMLTKSNGFSISIDLPNEYDDKKNTSEEIIALPLKEPTEPLHVGYLIRNDQDPDSIGTRYLSLLQAEIRKLQLSHRP